MLAVVVHALLAFSSPKLARPSGARQSVVVMAQKKVLKLDARGEFQAREVSASVRARGQRRHPPRRRLDTHALR